MIIAEEQNTLSTLFDDVKPDADGNRYVDEVSDLANWIENAGQEECLSNDWTSILK